MKQMYRRGGDIEMESFLDYRVSLNSVESGAEARKQGPDGSAKCCRRRCSKQATASSVPS